MLNTIKRNIYINYIEMLALKCVKLLLHNFNKIVLLTNISIRLKYKLFYFNLEINVIMQITII